MADSDSEVEITRGEAAVKKWATMKKLSPKTADRLIELGYDSMEALSLLSEDDLGEANIPIGQTRLLLYSLKQTFPRGQAASGNNANHCNQDPQTNVDPEPNIQNIGDDDVFIRNVLGQLNGAQTQQQPSQTGSSGNMNDSEVEITRGEAAVKKWATMKKLSPKTADRLIELGYDSMEALSLLSEDDLGEANIPIGQTKLLLYSLKQTFPRGQAASGNNANHCNQDPQTNEDPEPNIQNIGDDDVFIRNVLGQLNGAQTQQQPSQTGSSGNMNEMTEWGYYLITC
uniref:Uncharacterized protein n=1 Tax=Magallana gigas TaxID=29159 RepID=K1R2T4_MAGGI